MVIAITKNPIIPSIPKPELKKNTDVRYMLMPPYVSAHIHWDESKGELVYDIEEPVLSPDEQAKLKQLESAMLELVNINVAVDKGEEATTEYLDKTARLLVDELNLGLTEEGYRKMFYYLYRDFVGLNEVDPLLHDYFIEDIECNGVNTPVYVVHRMYRNMRTSLVYKDVEGLASFVEKIAQRSGRYVSYAQPLLDGTLPDGSRINATYTKDVTSRGPTFTIRKFTKIPWTPTQLIGMNALSPEMLAYFWILIENKSSIIVAGGTGSGKTTLLNALGFFIPPEDRVVSIEDTRELNLPRENWLPSVARASATGGKTGAVDLFALLKASFRQRPDYLIVGEVRGKEAFVLFQGMASGHASLSTVHADSTQTLVRRLMTPPISLSPTLVNTLDCVAIATHAVVGGKETRKMRELAEIVNVDDKGTANTNNAFAWDPRTDKFFSKPGSKVFEKIAQKRGFTVQQLQTEFVKRAKLLWTMYQQNVTEFHEVQRIINDYYKDPAPILARFGVK